MIGRALGITAFLALLTGCAPQPPVEPAPRVSERIILLPSDTDPASAIVVRAGQDEVVLATHYSQADLRGTELIARVATADEVNRQYGDLMAAQPKKAQAFTMFFVLGTDELTPQSKAAFDEARKQIASWPAAEVVVIGHTDRLGNEEQNNKLSLQRAQTIAKRLIASGVRADDVTVAGRGELEPLIPTADGVGEPRNRRVEIKVR